MARRGGLSHIHYKEIGGLKVASGQMVKSGTILTRHGGRWKPGLNVGGRATLYALAKGRVYFTKRKGTYNKIVTFINIKAEPEEKEK